MYFWYILTAYICALVLIFGLLLISYLSLKKKI